MSVDYLFLIGPRACGKSTVGSAVRRCLKHWWFVDLDHEFHSQYGARADAQLMLQPGKYYEASRDILLKMLDRRWVIMALGGGTLINPANPGGDSDVVLELKKRGPLVLLLPSRFDYLSRRILYRRERQREYGLPKRSLENLRAVTFRQYNTRIDFFRANADLVLYGRDPEALARRIVAHYRLSSD